MSDINEAFKAQKMFTSQEWKKMYADGTVTKWLQQVTDFFMTNANVKDSTPASKYFDPSLYISTIA
jgi:NitT/TauT family transport system substrate-binding protein